MQTNSHSHANSFSDADRDEYANPHANSISDTDPHADTNTDADVRPATAEFSELVAR